MIAGVCGPPGLPAAQQVRSFRERHAEQLEAWQEYTAAQVCASCGKAFDHVAELLEHVLVGCVVVRSSAGIKPGRCGVATSPGRLCACLACEGTGDLCTQCFHPRVLHGEADAPLPEERLLDPLVWVPSPAVVAESSPLAEREEGGCLRCGGSMMFGGCDCAATYDEWLEEDQDDDDALVC